METNRLDIVPGKIAPVIHTSQYDVGRVFRFYLYDGTSPFTLNGSETVTCSIRKTDGNIVILSVENTADNYVDVVTTEQSTACSGQNICELRIEDGEVNIGTMDFILQVESDPTEGGIESATEINNLRTQVSEMVGEEVASQYDAESVVFDNLPTEGHGIGFAVTSEGIKTAIKEATTPTGEVSGDIVTFDDALNGIPFIEVEAQIEATQSGSGTPSPDNPRPITGFNEVVITAGDGTHTIDLGQTVGRGVLNVTTGELTITHKIVPLTEGMSGGTVGGVYVFFKTIENAKTVSDSEIAPVIAEQYEAIRYNGVTGTANTIAIRSNGYLYVNTGNIATTPQGIALYELATPVTVQLTPEEVKAISGLNTVSANSGDIRVVYRKDFGIVADSVPYDNRASGLTADNVQDAIDEVTDTTYTKTEADALLADKADTADLATVATSGAYSDLTGKPTESNGVVVLGSIISAGYVTGSGNYVTCTIPLLNMANSATITGVGTVNIFTPEGAVANAVQLEQSSVVSLNHHGITVEFRLKTTQTANRPCTVQISSGLTFTLS